MVPMRPTQVGPSGILYNACDHKIHGNNSITPYNGTGMMFQVDPIMGTACDCWCNWCDDESHTHTHAGTLRRGKMLPTASAVSGTDFCTWQSGLVFFLHRGGWTMS